MANRLGVVSVLLLASACAADLAPEPEGEDVGDVYEETAVVDCEVIVAGGSTAALAAALTAAREGAQTCLLEPTDWVGGQLTASAVPAIDFAWHKVGELDVKRAAHDPRNIPRELNELLAAVGNPGSCWVSRNCFRPDAFHDNRLQPAIAAQSRLQVFLNTVVKDVVTQPGVEDTIIESLVAIRRTARPGVDAWDRRLSAELGDWYSPTSSARFVKETLRFRGVGGAIPIVIDATELGDVLVLSGAPYLQGAEVLDGTTELADDRCGQAAVVPFAMKYHTGPRTEPPVPLPTEHRDFYGLGAHSWERIWSYRRIIKAPGQALYGDVTLQNWNPGNDFPFGYLLLGAAATEAQRSNWQGGVDLTALAALELHAYGFYNWFKARAPNGQSSWLTLDREILGSSTGLAKMPYLRDTRRSVGLDGFVLAGRHFRGTAADVTGTRFADRVAIGSYVVDIHPLHTCRLPSWAFGSPLTLPYFIPFRALTNADLENLLVAGKTMAQSSLANAATRLQPTEWSTGIAAGAAAAHMRAAGLETTREALQNIGAIQARIRNHAPIDWTIDGNTYPAANEVLPPVAQTIYCPDGARFDEGYGFCVSGEHAWGPFTHGMIERCNAAGGGNACSQTTVTTIAGRSVRLRRWAKSFARTIRGDGSCPLGAERSAEYLGHCTERYFDGQAWQHDVFGPFGADLVEACSRAGGGNACVTHRWGAPFFRQLVGSLR